MNLGLSAGLSRRIENIDGKGRSRGSSSRVGLAGLIDLIVDLGVRGWHDLGEVNVGIELNAQNRAAAGGCGEMSGDQVDSRLVEVRASAELDVFTGGAFGKVGAAIHAVENRCIECGERLVLRGESEVRIRLHHPADVL